MNHWECPFCKVQYSSVPQKVKKITTAGWIGFFIMLPIGGKECVTL